MHTTSLEAGSPGLLQQLSHAIKEPVPVSSSFGCKVSVIAPGILSMFKVRRKARVSPVMDSPFIK